VCPEPRHDDGHSEGKKKKKKESEFDSVSRVGAPRPPSPNGFEMMAEGRCKRKWPRARTPKVLEKLAAEGELVQIEAADTLIDSDFSAGRPIGGNRPRTVFHTRGGTDGAVPPGGPGKTSTKGVLEKSGAASAAGGSSARRSPRSRAVVHAKEEKENRPASD